jgi:mannose-6-phosphate isomerase
MHRLSNPVRPYPWGSTSTIPDLLGTPDDGAPKAELWLGAHPDSPSLLPDGTRLDAAIAADPASLVGPGVQASFGPRLPYLLKVLSAVAPLSLQVHPNSEQAAAGFADEQDRQVPQDAEVRRYRDPFHKPEMVVALEPFDALCGLRDPAQTAELLAGLAVEHPSWQRLRELVSGSPADAALRRTVSWLLGGDEQVPSLVRAVAAAAVARPDRPEYVTTAALAEAYPGDPGVLVALLLNRVLLAAGEALFLPAGNIHSYLSGTAVEVMASSDNVLRAGLTNKHVDAAELVRITDFTPRPLPVVVPERHGPVLVYRPGAAEFELAHVTLTESDGRDWHDLPVEGPRILLVLDGELEASVGSDAPGRPDRPGTVEHVGRGTSLFVPAVSGVLAVRGVGTAVVAGVPAT